GRAEPHARPQLGRADGAQQRATPACFELAAPGASEASSGFARAHPDGARRLRADDTRVAPPGLPLRAARALVRHRHRQPRPSPPRARAPPPDRPAALAELRAIIANAGVRGPTTSIQSLRFAADTPYHTVFTPKTNAESERVMSVAVARALRKTLAEVVEA